MVNYQYSFSLIVCTINKPFSVLKDLFNSLLCQKYQNFEIILVDQNVNNDISEFINSYRKTLHINYIRSTVKGLSRNRNLGIINSKNEVLCFPDDDCTYDSNTLKDVNSFFSNNPNFDFYCCSVKDKLSNTSFPMPYENCIITSKNYYNKCISIGIFYKKNGTTFLFDEKMGVGTRFGSAEESDFISNLLFNGHKKGFYNGKMFVYHPLPSSTTSALRHFNYGMGYGALMKKEISYRKKYYFSYVFFFDLLSRLIFSFFPIKKRQLYWQSFKGRFIGFISYKK